MKTRSICAGKTNVTGESQYGSAQIDKSPEYIIIICIPVGDNKEVTITQIGDNKDNELEDSAPSSIYGEKLPKEKWLNVPTTEPKHLRKSNMGMLPIIADGSDMVEQQQGREGLYCKPQQLTPERG